jgi:uncharacterized protein (TIGR02145 family)
MFSCERPDIVRIIKIETLPVTNYTSTTAILSGRIIDSGEGMKEYGFYWWVEGQEANPFLKQNLGDKTGNYSNSVDGLQPNTTYFVKAYANDGNSIVSGKVVQFITLADLPSITTVAVSSVTLNSAQSGGNVTSDGGSPVTARGVCWDTVQGPTIANDSTIDGTGTGLFTSYLKDLSPKTNYYVRAYATNATGTAYGGELSFTTGTQPPEAITNEATDKTASTATLNGSVNAYNSSTTVSFEYGITTSYGQNINATPNTVTGNSLTNVSANITGLDPNTTYHFRVKAANAGGTVYGNNLIFTTKDGIILLTTAAATNITATTVTSGGNITDDGGFSVTARGVCWNTSQNPITANNKTNDGKGTGSFVTSLSPLSSNTTYYARAYAINTQGTTFYGNQVYFTTSPPGTNNLPVITSSPQKDVDEDVPYSYTLTATDADAGDVLTYSRVQTPSWLNFNSSSHLLSGTPTNSNVGDHYVSLSVSDGTAIVYNNFTITVHNINDNPVITSIPITSATVGVYYSYQLTAIDVDGDNLTISATVLPSWLSFMPSSSTGLLSGTPAPFDAGNHSVSLKVSDGTAEVTQSFNIYVVQPTCTFTDSRDGKIYNCVTIGEQVWMAENLAYLPAVSLPTTGSGTDPYYYVYGYNGTSVIEAKASANYATYGVLYNWPAAMNGEVSSNANPSGVQGVCPTGWHLPSDAEWKQLEMYLGMSQADADKIDLRGTTEGGKLKEAGMSHWYSPNEGATNSSGFTALAGGYRDNLGYCSGIVSSGFWKSATELDANIYWYRALSYDYASVRRQISSKGDGGSVRCVRDN